jgi:rare lipoprotein A
MMTSNRLAPQVGFACAALIFCLAMGLAPDAEAAEAQAGATSGWAASVATTAALPAPKARHHEIGIASFYSGRGRTASGMKGFGGMTAAHRRLPFGSRVKVRDVKTGREVIVTITDRGPFRRGRIIDISRKAAAELGITSRGVAKVEVSAVH